jgi:flagellar hook-basal body complex protein FliE
MATKKEQETTPEDGNGGDEVDSLKQENVRLAVEVKSREAAVLKLEQALATKDGEIADLKQALDEAKQSLEELCKALPRAVAAYKELVVESNPGVLAELIIGETIEEVNESLKNARSLMERVRQEIEAEAARTRVPAGAPQRTPLDLSTLSAREKIQYAIGGSSP